MPESLTGDVERVTYHNPQNGFAVLRVKVRGHQDLVTVVGNVTSVTAGEHLEASGRWVMDREHGRQFQAETLKTTHPATPEGIERYLGSGSLRSVGPKLAAKIVRLYGAGTLRILDEFPETLRHVRGIGPERLRRIRESWQEQKHVREIMLFLHAHGISSGRAVRIYRTYGAQAIATIKRNPYRLADDIRGIGFKTADELARKLGLDPGSPQRARAAVRYTLQELTAAGHCGYPAAEVVDRTARLIEIEPWLAEAAVEHLVGQGAVVREENDEAAWLFLAPLHQAEGGLAESVRRLASGGTHPLPRIDLDVALGWVENKLRLELAEAQRDAVREACRETLLVITGGPGVGKTTLVRSILEIFEAKGRQCVLAAPTGRAARRLAETTGRSARTLHRLLEFDPATGEFKKDAQSPLTGDLFVLDEVSMVDVLLGHQFLRAVPDGACVVLAGDVDQLPSVGPGSVLADLIESRIVPVVRLTQVFRQAQQSRIIQAAHAVNRGELPGLEAPQDALADFYFAEVEEPEAIARMIVRLVRERIPERFGFDPRADVQVLTPMNRAVLGTRNLNHVLQAALNPPRDGTVQVERFGWTFRAGDRVIQTENNYDREVSNGDLGVIGGLDEIEQELTVSFEGRSVTYDFGSLDELSLAYALSVHKSQGSEYPCVVIPVHTQHYLLLQRNLLYTGITRGRKLVVLVGSRKALELAVRRQDAGRRYTALRRRLEERQGPSEEL